MRAYKGKGAPATVNCAGSSAEISILEWAWPLPPAIISLYDKYTDATYVVKADENEWKFSYKGDAESISFASGSAGALQRRLAMLTSGHQSPGSLHRAARLLVRKWESVCTLVTTPAEELRNAWNEHVTDSSFQVL